MSWVYFGTRRKKILAWVLVPKWHVSWLRRADRVNRGWTLDFEASTPLATSKIGF